MTCRRLEEDLLGDLGAAPDPHIEQCPDCSARMQGYQRIAGWIADGRTMQRPSAEWRNRMFAHVLGDGARLRSIQRAPTGSQPMASVEPATELPARPPGADLRASSSAAEAPASPPGADVLARPFEDALARQPAIALAESENPRGPSRSRRRQRRWVRAVIPIVGAAVAMAAALIVRCGGDLQPPRVAIETPNPSGKGESSGRGHAPEHGAPEPTGSAAAAPALPSKGPAAGDSQGASKQPGSTRHASDPSGSQRPAVPSTKRGGDVVVDWGGDGSTSAPDERAAAHVAFEAPTGDLGGRTAEEIERVIKSRVALYRACYLRELARAPTIRGKLVVHLVIDGDGRVQSIDSPAASATTLHNDAVTECVIGHMKRLRFPDTGQMASVTSSIELAPED